MKKPTLIEALRQIAETPKHGEPEPCDPEFNQNWEEDLGSYAIEKLHELIDLARAAVANLKP